MNQVIIYKQIGGVMAVIHPAPDIVLLYGIDAIAQKDVPFGMPYKIIDESEVPKDRTLRQTWIVEDVYLTDGVGASFSTFDVI